MKTKKTVKHSKLTPLEKRKFFVDVYFYFLWIDHNEDLLDPYLLGLKEQKEEADIPEPEELTDKVETKEQFSEDSKIKVSKFNFKIIVRPLISFVCLALLVLIVQIIYPSGKTLPFVKLDSQGFIGYADQQKILESLSDFDKRIVTVHTQNKSITTSYKDLGVSINPIETSKKMTDYPISKRLIPFSIFIYGSKNYSSVREINDSQLKLFVDNVVAQSSKQSVDALVTIAGTKLTVSGSEEGYEYKFDSLKSSILNSDLRDNGQVVFTPTILFPDITTELAQTNAIRMQERINSPINILAEDKTMIIDPETIASWVEIQHKPDQKTVNIIFNKDKVRQSLSSFPGTVDYPSKPAVTTILNGNSVGRTEGAVGKSLQFDELVELVTDTTSPATSTVQARVETLIPQEQIDRRYSKDSVGMQSLLDYWKANNSGEYGIDFKTLNGRISANVNSNRLFPAVGIHKAYIAGLIYNRIASGSIGFDTLTQTGDTVDVCLTKMVVHSDESCTNALGNMIGWSSSDSILSSVGLTSTTLTQNASLSSSRDATDWLVKLSAGNITTVNHSYLLTDLMSNQGIRSGIPSGSDGMRVENKSGSFGRVVNDMALVYHPGGEYALTVMSEGGSYEKIADLAREINRVMSQ